MEFYLFLGKLIENLWVNIFLYLLFLGGYFFIFRNRIWSIVDPLFMQVLAMASASYCVYILSIYDLINFKYSFSFILTETSFLIGFFLVRNVKDQRLRSNSEENFSYKEFQVFIWTAALVYFVSQIVTFSTVGVILFREDTNHLFAFQEHSFIRVFSTYSKIIFLIAVFYKWHLIGKFTGFEKTLIGFTVISTILGGSKSALLTFFALFIIVNFTYSQRTGNKILKIKPSVIVILFLSAVGIIALQGNKSLGSALELLYYRFIGSGDIFVLGYNENAIRSINETSGFKYIFYPGIGTLLKFFMEFPAPHIIGVDVAYFHTGKMDSGPNARHNYLGMIFWGYGGIFFSFICGYIISLVRNNMLFIGNNGRQFIYFIVICLTVYSITDLITDANLFMNNMVWSLFMLGIIYALSCFFSILFFMNAESKSNQQLC